MTKSVEQKVTVTDRIDYGKGEATVTVTFMDNKPSCISGSIRDISSSDSDLVHFNVGRARSVALALAGLETITKAAREILLDMENKK